MKPTEELQKDVVEELAWDPEVDASEIGVTTGAEGVVTLTGRVKSYAQKRSAEQVVKRVLGVHGVANEIEVSPGPKALRDDADIAEASVRALRWYTDVPDDIQVTVSNGWLKLEGEVEWEYQRRAAHNAVRGLAGVMGVTNRITVEPEIEPTEIQDRIKQAFQRSAEIDAEQVTVAAEGGKVILSGTVRSLAEKEEAERSAWSAPGVNSVDNRIVVKAGAFV